MAPYAPGAEAAGMIADRSHKSTPLASGGPTADLEFRLTREAETRSVYAMALPEGRGGRRGLRGRRISRAGLREPEAAGTLACVLRTD